MIKSKNININFLIIILYSITSRCCLPSQLPKGALLVKSNIINTVATQVSVQPSSEKHHNFTVLSQEPVTKNVILYLLESLILSG